MTRDISEEILNQWLRNTGSTKVRSGIRMSQNTVRAVTAAGSLNSSSVLLLSSVLFLPSLIVVALSQNRGYSSFFMEWSYTREYYTGPGGTFYFRSAGAGGGVKLSRWRYSRHTYRRLRLVLL
jgi:hypothetical protein